VKIIDLEQNQRKDGPMTTNWCGYSTFLTGIGNLAMMENDGEK